MLPNKLGKRASVAEAQTAAGFHPIQYKSFVVRVHNPSATIRNRYLFVQMITHQAASDLMRQNASWTRWPCVPQAVKFETQKWVNDELNKQNIPEVREDIFHWRMSRALPDAARAACKPISRNMMIIVLLTNSQ